MVLHVAYPEVLYILIPVLLGAVTYRFFYYKYPIYSYPMISILPSSKIVKKSHRKSILSILRFFALIFLSFFIARPQWVDEKSYIDVKGIDIVLTIDVSGSMQLFDDLKDRRPRLQVAKQEALRFIEKRTNDPIGIVLFGNEDETLIQLFPPSFVLNMLALSEK